MMPEAYQQLTWIGDFEIVSMRQRIRDHCFAISASGRTMVWKILRYASVYTLLGADSGAVLESGGVYCQEVQV